MAEILLSFLWGSHTPGYVLRRISMERTNDRIVKVVSYRFLNSYLVRNDHRPKEKCSTASGHDV